MWRGLGEEKGGRGRGWEEEKGEVGGLLDSEGTGIGGQEGGWGGPRGDKMGRERGQETEVGEVGMPEAEGKTEGGVGGEEERGWYRVGGPQGKSEGLGEGAGNRWGHKNEVGEVGEEWKEISGDGMELG